MKKSIKAIMSVGLSLAFLAGGMPAFSQTITDNGQINSVTPHGTNTLGDGVTWGEVDAPVSGDDVTAEVEWHYEIPSIIAMIVFKDDFDDTGAAYPATGVFSATEAPAGYLVSSKLGYPQGGTDNVLADLIAASDEVGDEEDFVINGSMFTYPKGGVLFTVSGPVPTLDAAVAGEIALTHSGGAASGEINVRMFGGIGVTVGSPTKDFSSFDAATAPQIDLGVTGIEAADFDTNGYTALSLKGDVNEATVTMADDQPGLYSGALTIVMEKI